MKIFGVEIKVTKVQYISMLAFCHLEQGVYLESRLLGELGSSSQALENHGCPWLPAGWQCPGIFGCEVMLESLLMTLCIALNFLSALQMMFLMTIKSLSFGIGKRFSFVTRK